MRFLYPASDEPGPEELKEIKRRLAENGFVLLWSNKVKAKMVWYREKKDLQKAPPGFIHYSVKELEEMFGEGKPEHTPSSLQLIHAAKGEGAEVVRSATFWDSLGPGKKGD